ncbi:ketohexokinase [Nasonia vitripennis]|uniref:Carbohydrate kinase PfkB domain-containing protein n=1 Tax=Nasonia vitripennis TaxID=7425 RepID=A0A7M7G1Y0_NASVI|nr:ketohexokinase [Nasonia vitripennis]
MISTFYERIVGTSPPPEPNEPKILCVGLSCLDIVQLCKHYPEEDTDQRCIDFRYQRGGNASNNCTVISQFGQPCEFLGVLSNEQFSRFLQDDMRKHKIDFSHCPMVEDGGCPTSVVVLSMSTGSRTIIHHNQNHAEITLQDFEKLNLEDYSWVHFEGRNIAEVLLMMQHIENYNRSLAQTSSEGDDKFTHHHLPITISVELEKMRPELLDLLPYADVAFVSKDFAECRGYVNMSETLKNVSQDAKTGATIFSAWGDRGAMARAPDGSIVQSPAFPPHKIIDTLGAGDTFNASILYYLNKEKLAYKKGSRSDESAKNEILQNYNIESSEKSQTEFINRDVLQGAVNFGCRLAGAKIGLRGFEGLCDVYKNYL